MPTNTYVALDRVTLGSATGTVTFSSINQGYTDLVLVCSNTRTNTGDVGLRIRFNGDSGNNYSNTFLYGTGSSAGSVRNTNSTSCNAYYAAFFGTASNAFSVTNIQNYSNTTTNKTVLTRDGDAATGTDAIVSLWRNTAAITQIDLTCSNGTSLFAAGSTFSLYGIKAWAAETTPKATGGYVYEDSTYYYHAFPFSGTFTPNQSLTCDYLVIAGGGGSSLGGGGAGGLRSTVGTTGGGGTLESALSLTAQAYAITIGAGGAGTLAATAQIQGGDGTNSVFSTITSIGGGGGGAGGANGSYNDGRNGGSGGGSHNGGQPRYPGSGTANQGYAGGAVSDGGTGSGGGGAGSVGGDRRVVNTVGGLGGSGVTIPAFFNATGTGLAGVYAAGGAGFPGNNLSGQSGTGFGGNAATVVGNISGNGGSGLVIIRYAK